MNRQTFVSVQNISKKFSATLRTSMRNGLLDVCKNLFHLPYHPAHLRKGEFWALQNVSFDLAPGDSIGLVGPNGSGKSTLLKLMNGIMRPDSGFIRRRGRIGALIEVGAGFHPMLTGRENIYVNGAILGMTHTEIKRSFDKIVDFAEIGEFIDMPVKKYSSGMFVRLGFSIAAHCRPDILLVDEVLAVGDIAFQKKCLRHIEDILSNQGTILVLVSHSIYAVSRLCERALLLNHGVMEYLGSSKEIASRYFNAVRPKLVSKKHTLFNQNRDGAGEARVEKIEIHDRTGTKISTVQTGQEIEILLTIESTRDFPVIPQVQLWISDVSANVIVCAFIPGAVLRNMSLKRGRNRLSCRFGSLNLVPGNYILGIKLGGAGDILQDVIHDALSIEIAADPAIWESTGGRGMVYGSNEWRIYAK